MSTRNVKALHAAVRDDIGDLVTRRPLPGGGVDQIDPFLFLNHHGPQTYPPRNRGLPFGPHPHRGFETVTFIIQGELAHRDTAGHESIIRAGGVQWMTAGRGIVHEEISPAPFREQGGPLEILQLWVNLPSRLKGAPPHYVGLQAHDIPALEIDGGRASLHLISGDWNGHHGPVATLTNVFMSMVSLAQDGRVTVENIAGRNVFLYVVRGGIRVGDQRADAFTLVELEREGDALEIQATVPSILLLGHADAIGEPVVSYGPFVMNTRQEIEQAIRDYQAGKFDAVTGGTQ